MEIRRIADRVAVTGQIGVADVGTIAEMGFRTLISNRPDHEEGTTPHERIRSAAEASGLKFFHVPVVSGAITSDDVSDMAAVMSGAERPVLAYCRTGARCIDLLRRVGMAR